MKKGFTLIELLAVIIILAVVALIATPIVLDVVKTSKDSAYKSQLNLYADSIKHQLAKEYLTNGGKYSDIIDLSDQNLNQSINCEEAHFTKDNKVLLGNCTIKGSSDKFYYINGEVHKEKPASFDTLKNDLIASSGEISKGYKDNSGANKPELYDKMIPVIYENDNWVYADINSKWYDYDNKEWANAVVLNDGVTKSVGNTISESDIAMMYVWIPRYKYTIFNGNNGGVSPQQIDVVFESGTAKTGTVTCTTATVGSGSTSENCGTVTNGSSTYTHPAFTFGTKELTGIWVGKFENSAPNATTNSVQKVSIKPNVISWRSTIVSNFYQSILNIKTDYSMSGIDSHMMKNMEWGAVAYLTQSKYGRCTSGVCIEVSRNDSSDFYTGRSDGTSGSGTGSSAAGTYQYNTTNGMLASTTGNIYGIYDMSGGAYEYVMGNMVNSSNQFYSSYAGFGTTPPTKYYDLYTYGKDYLQHSRGRLGDATKETLQTYGSHTGGWYGDHAYFPNSTGSWFVRGGLFGSGANAGVFYFSYTDGHANSNYAARAVVSADDN